MAYVTHPTLWKIKDAYHGVSRGSEQPEGDEAHEQTDTARPCPSEAPSSTPSEYGSEQPDVPQAPFYDNPPG